MLAPVSLIRELVVTPFPDYPSVTGLPRHLTIGSLSSFLTSLAWAWLLLVSLTGWGRLIARLIRVEPIPASIACSLGIASVIFAGGLLNLVHTLFPAVLVALVVLGLFLYGATYRTRPALYSWTNFWRLASPQARFLLVAALVILAFRTAATVRLGMFNSLDDGAAYLVFPHKLLASHAFAFDPFSDRRVISSLGGAYLLQAFVIAGTSLTHIAMADRTLGMILLAAALFDLGIAFRLSPSQMGLLEFLAYLIPQETINLTFVILPTSLLIAMVWMIFQTPEEEGAAQARYALVVGAIGGAIISLKSTFLPCVGAIALIPYVVLYYSRKRVTFLRLPVIAGLGCLMVLAAWMAAMKIDSGTYLFPLFGYGVDYSSYGIFHAAVKFTSKRALVKIFLQAIALLALAFVQLIAGTKSRQTNLSLSILVASAVAITAFNYKSGGDFIWRYNFPQFFSAILIFYTANAGIVHLRPELRRTRVAFSLGVLSLIGMIFYYDAAGKKPQPFRQITMELPDYLRGLRASLNGVDLSNPGLAKEYRAVENSLPVHAKAIENTAYPFLFTYRDRILLLADWPGAASPKPGWPFATNGNPLTDYLSGQSIRYIIYDYNYARWIDVEACKAMESPNLNSQELLALWWMTVLSHNQLDHIRQMYKPVYDDGKIAVIDLQSRAPNPDTTVPVWTEDTNKDQICSAAMARYVAASNDANR